MFDTCRTIHACSNPLFSGTYGRSNGSAYTVSYNFRIACCHDASTDSRTYVGFNPYEDTRAGDFANPCTDCYGCAHTSAYEGTYPNSHPNSYTNAGVYTDSGRYGYAGFCLLQKRFNEDGFALGDTIFTPSFIGFTAVEENSRTLYVTNGAKVQSKYFKVQAVDENGLKELKVYLDGDLILTKTADFSNVYLSRRGSYKIVATDSFGNTSNFTFTNDFEDVVEYYVDGEKLSTNVEFTEYFDGKTYEQKGLQFFERVVSPLFFNDAVTDRAPFYLYVNVTTAETLRKVLANPKKYAPNGVYIMRIHGTFVNFLDLSPAIQEDIIKRLDPGSTAIC